MKAFNSMILTICPPHTNFNKRLLIKTYFVLFCQLGIELVILAIANTLWKQEVPLVIHFTVEHNGRSSNLCGDKALKEYIPVVSTSIHHLQFVCIWPPIVETGMTPHSTGLFHKCYLLLYLRWQPYVI